MKRGLSVFCLSLFLALGIALVFVVVSGLFRTVVTLDFGHPKVLLNMVLGLLGLWIAIRSAQRLFKPHKPAKTVSGFTQRFAKLNLLGIVILAGSLVALRISGFQTPSRIVGATLIVFFLMIPVSIALVITDRLRASHINSQHDEVKKSASGGGTGNDPKNVRAGGGDAA